MNEEEMTQSQIERRKKAILDLRYKGLYGPVLDEIGNFIADLINNNPRGEQIEKNWNLHEHVQKSIGWAMHERGVTFQNMRTNWSAAIECLWDAFAYREAIKDIVGQAYTIFQIPMCRLARGDEKEDVLPDFQRAKPYILNVIEAQGSMLISIRMAEILGDMHQNLAYIYQQENDIVEAKKSYKKALDYRNKAGDKRGEAVTLARMAEIEDDFEKAKGYLNEAEKVFVSINDVSRLKQIKETREKIQKKKEGEKK